jgi:hypothetical protein
MSREGTCPGSSSDREPGALFRDRFPRVWVTGSFVIFERNESTLKEVQMCQVVLMLAIGTGTEHVVISGSVLVHRFRLSVDGFGKRDGAS